MVAAFKNTPEEILTESGQSDEDDPDPESDSEVDDQRYHQVNMDRTSCVVHTLQLVVLMVQKEVTVNSLLDKARSMVKLFRKSSIATQRVLKECGLILIQDCPARWSSTFNMVARLIKLKDTVCQIASDMGWDTLVTSEWQRLSLVYALLSPFAEHTKTLQSDTTSLSQVVPSLLDLRSHLTEFIRSTRYSGFATLAEKMKANLSQRFACLLDPADEKFSPLAAAACFVNPTVCEMLVNVNVSDGNIQELLTQAEDYVAKSTLPPNMAERQEDEEDPSEDAEGKSEEAGAAASSKQPVFRFLSKCRTTRPKQRTPKTSTRQQIIKYKEEIAHPITEETAIGFWLEKSDTFYHSLKPFALDLLSMPASQAFAKRVFSVTGDLTRGKRNRGRVTLERSALLKMNKNK
ncbi:zinc finger BED domain-containing protein 4-like [Chaetodon trifascialis]|uniref:zinc finger BED domain-containing protein 4-like n=1 Tax=Chaetodon trifascialis TaxID=109706 RepID=UPI003991495B